MRTCDKIHQNGSPPPDSLNWDASRLQSGSAEPCGLGPARIIFFMSLVKDPFITVKFSQ